MTTATSDYTIRFTRTDGIEYALTIPARDEDEALVTLCLEQADVKEVIEVTRKIPK